MVETHGRYALLLSLNQMAHSVPCPRNGERTVRSANGPRQPSKKKSRPVCGTAQVARLLALGLAEEVFEDLLLGLLLGEPERHELGNGLASDLADGCLVDQLRLG